MTSSLAPSPGPPDQPPGPRRAGSVRTWLRTRLAARIQRTGRARQPASPAPQPASPTRLPLAPAPAPAAPARLDPEFDLWEPPDLTGGYQHGAPAYRVVLQISPQLRERHPEWPLSLEEALNLGHPPPEPSPDHRGRSRWTEMQGIIQAPARTRAVIRDTLTDWGLTALSPDAERLAADLAADAARHAPGHPFGLSIQEHRPPGQPRWIRCAITGTSPQPPTARPAPEPGRPAITTGCDTTPGVTTTWFTLTAPSRQPDRPAPEHDRQLEPGA